jgi:hypothetical protein
MFWILALIMGVLWILGLTQGYAFGGAIHILLLGAMVMAFFGLRQWWRRPA